MGVQIASGGCDVIRTVQTFLFCHKTFTDNAGLLIGEFYFVYISLCHTSIAVDALLYCNYAALDY